MTAEADKPADPVAEAAVWVVRRQSGALDAQAQAELRRWLAAEPGNAAALEAALDAWGGLDAEPALARRTRRAAVGVMAGRAAAPAGVAAALALGVWTWFGAIHTLELHTGVGETRTAALPDGSTVRLDSLTALTVRQDLLGRQVELARGQAEFAVARQRWRPFRVRTDQMQVTALGTRFTVSEAGPSDRAALLEGRVAVQAGGRTLELKPGESAWAGRGGVGKGITDPDADLAWTRGRIVLSDVQLADAVARFAPYAPGTVTFEDRWMQTLRVSGSFRTADRTAFLRSAADLHGLRLEQIGPDAWRLVRP
jgi:transmembrane sensor